MGEFSLRLIRYKVKLYLTRKTQVWKETQSKQQNSKQR